MLNQGARLVLDTSHTPIPPSTIIYENTVLVLHPTWRESSHCPQQHILCLPTVMACSGQLRKADRISPVLCGTATKPSESTGAMSVPHHTVTSQHQEGNWQITHDNTITHATVQALLTGLDLLGMHTYWLATLLLKGCCTTGAVALHCTTSQLTSGLSCAQCGAICGT